VDLVEDAGEALARRDIDAVVIATPPGTHYPLALAALENGKHVLVEKPLARESSQCERLMEEAKARNLTLMVDHIFVYTPAVNRIRELVLRPDFGEVLYYDSVRANLGLFQSDVSVLWDLAVHDLSIMDYIIPVKPVAVSATGINHFQDVANIAYMTVFFDSPVVAHIGANWLAPVKVRQVLIGGSRHMIVYNDVEPSEKVKVYDKGVDVNSQPGPEGLRKMLVSYRTGDMWSPFLDHREALQSVVEHFMSWVVGGQPPLTGGEAGLRVVRVLEAAEKSLQTNGRPVEINGKGAGA
jgi:predicted dehydrogenase